MKVKSLLNLAFLKSDAYLYDEIAEIFQKYPESFDTTREQSDENGKTLATTREAISNLNGLFLTSINYNQAELDLKSDINLKQSYNQ
jgi:hypothetical protein